MQKRLSHWRLIGFVGLFLNSPVMGQTARPVSVPVVATEADEEEEEAQDVQPPTSADDEVHYVVRNDPSYMAIRFATTESHIGTSFTLDADAAEPENLALDLGQSLLDVHLVSVERELAFGWNLTLGSATVHLAGNGLTATPRDGVSGLVLPDFGTQVGYRFDLGDECRPTAGAAIDLQNIIMNDTSVSPGGGSGRVRGAVVGGLACTNGRYSAIASLGAGLGVIAPFELTARTGEADFTGTFLGRLDLSLDDVFLRLMTAVDVPLNSPALVTGEVDVRIPLVEVPFNILGGDSGELYAGATAQVAVRLDPGPLSDDSYLGDGFSGHVVMGIQETHHGRFVGDRAE